MDDWLDFMEQRQKYLEQSWNATRWATDSVDPKFITINQVSSSYAPGDTTDGVDTRQDRAYDVLSGHGGYSDAGYGTMFPVRSAEAFAGFGQGKPHFYLPTWGTMNWAQARNGVWMSWITKLEGIEYPPGEDYALADGEGGYDGTNTVFEIAEVNRRLALVGDVMRQIPKTLAPVAVLHSTRQDAWDIATLNSPKIHTPGSPEYAGIHRAAVDCCFFRVMEQGMVPNWIDEVEATAKGADFLKQWKVIMCPRLTTATPAFQKALEGYVAAGGKLIQFKGDGLIIKGSIIADHGFGDPSAHWEEVQKNGGYSSPMYRDLQWRKWNNDLAPTFAKDFARLGRRAAIPQQQPRHPSRRPQGGRRDVPAVRQQRPEPGGPARRQGGADSGGDDGDDPGGRRGLQSLQRRRGAGQGRKGNAAAGSRRRGLLALFAGSGRRAGLYDIVPAPTGRSDAQRHLRELARLPPPPSANIGRLWSAVGRTVPHDRTQWQRLLV